jgi:predicted  nucleic acid-binding Zn-ribbon protein
MSQTRALHRLQKLDLELEARRSRSREVAAALEDDRALRAAQAEADALEGRLRPQEARAADLTLEIKSVVEQTRQLNDRLYSGAVGNPKELEDLQNKIAERGRRHAALEDSLLETMIAVEELQAALEEARERLRQAETERAAAQETLGAEWQRLKSEIKRLKADRERAAGQISPEFLEVYQTLRARKSGHAIALLEGENCSVCGVGQTTVTAQQVRQNLELITCESCGRILVAS